MNLLSGDQNGYDAGCASVNILAVNEFTGLTQSLSLPVESLPTNAMNFPLGDIATLLPIVLSYTTFSGGSIEDFVSR